MLKFIFKIALCCCLPLGLWAQSAENGAKDTVAHKLHQLRLGFDLSKPILNAANKDIQAYEFCIDYYLQKELYAVVDWGWGKSAINYPDLKYNSSSSFIKIGVDKSLFPRRIYNDWGMGFIGVRYGMGQVNRGDVSYTTDDGFGNQTSGVIASKKSMAYWLELNGGMRVELFRGLFAGWNVRLKFLLNPNSFGELKPAAIAGYGPGEKSTAFSYNFFLAYAIRWGH